MPTFDLSQYEDLARWLKDSTADGVRKGLASAGFRLVGIIQNEIIPAEKVPPIFDGHYRASWKVETTDQGADVFSESPIAGIIEHGVQAANVKIGRAMLDALAEWARRKGISGNYAPGKRSSPGAHAEGRQIAWAIARSMQGTPAKPGTGIFNRDGQQGLQIAKKAALRIRDFVEEEVRDAIRRATK